MNDWKEAREVIVGLLKYGTATDQPFTPVGKKALSTALKALDIMGKVVREMPKKKNIATDWFSGYNIAIDKCFPILAQKEKRIEKLGEGLKEISITFADDYSDYHKVEKAEHIIKELEKELTKLKETDL